MNAWQVRLSVRGLEGWLAWDINNFWGMHSFTTHAEAMAYADGEAQK